MVCIEHPWQTSSDLHIIPSPHTPRMSYSPPHLSPGPWNQKIIFYSTRIVAANSLNNRICLRIEGWKMTITPAAEVGVLLTNVGYTLVSRWKHWVLSCSGNLCVNTKSNFGIVILLQHLTYFAHQLSKLALIAISCHRQP